MFVFLSTLSYFSVRVADRRTCLYPGYAEFCSAARFPFRPCLLQKKFTK